MPFVRIDLAAGKPAAYRRTLGDVVYEATRATIAVPENDRFQVITEHGPDGLIFDAHYFGIDRSADCVFIQITLSEGRSLDAKKALYQAIVDGLHERLGLRREDVLINLVETKKENWSFGNGIAQYVA